jgi:hypothetical protein
MCHRLLPLVRLPTLLRNRSAIAGLAAGSVYGLLSRVAVSAAHGFSSAFAVMTLGFLFLVPLTMGYLTVAAAERPSWQYRVFAPWVSSIIVVLAAVAFGWEGSICLAMALPVMLVFSSVGGVSVPVRDSRRLAIAPIVALLPWAVMPAERGWQHPERRTTSVSEITIDASPSRVWPLVVSVDTIRAAEQHRALFTSMGFPRPIAATIDRYGVGGVRTATFERGVVFRELVTDWIAERRLRFTIDPIVVPDSAMDPHIKIGGPYFDVLTGTYELHPLANGRTRLVLRSEHRTSTAFNLYASWWADRVMASIQRNILGVLRDRAERVPARGSGGVAH